MIKKHCFSRDWVESFRKAKAHNKIQTNILEKMIYALHLLELLQKFGLDFVFKGGTSLVLLMEDGNRFSIDIDIICKQDVKDIESVLEKIIEESVFQGYTYDKERSFRSGVPKAHYNFSYPSVYSTKFSGTITLDILQADHYYPEIVKTEIKSKWIETTDNIFVTTPSIDSITGDKLTAFAPNTIGIPYYRGNQPLNTEIIKQLFDLGNLVPVISNKEDLKESFKNHIKHQISYRNQEGVKNQITELDVITDIVETCMIITRRDRNKTAKEKEQFQFLQKGIQSFNFGYLMTGSYRIDDAILSASRVARLVSELTEIHFNLSKEDRSVIERLNRLADKEAYRNWLIVAPPI